MKWAGVLAIGLAPALCAADENFGLYGRQRLADEAPRLTSRMREMHTRLVGLLTAEQRRRLADVRLEFPLIEETGDILSFYSMPAQRKVTMPVHSLLLLEDACTAHGWLYTKRYKMDTIDEYAAMLKYKPRAEFPGDRYPLPLEALQIPAKALDDPEVDALALRFRNSAFGFILAHELGHVYYAHRGNRAVAPEQSQKDEREADRFALELLARGKTIPMGAILYFEATAYSSANRADFRDDGEWQRYLARATHPTTAARLRDLSISLDQVARAYGKDEENVRFIARKVLSISRFLEDTDLQRAMANKVRAADVTSLAPRPMAGE